MPRDLSERIARARAVPITDEIRRRRMSLRRVGLELVGACPVCGDGGKGSRSNRFAVHLRKNVSLCRQCNAGGGVVDLVMHLDGIGFNIRKREPRRRSATCLAATMPAGAARR